MSDGLRRWLSWLGAIGCIVANGVITLLLAIAGEITSDDLAARQHECVERLRVHARD